MITDGLHCRLVALRNGNFDAVRQVARRFGKPTTTHFWESSSAIEWEEFLSFETGEWSWVSGIPATKIKIRIAVLYFGNLRIESGAVVSVFGIISSFPSLCNAGRNYFERVLANDHISLYVNLNGITNDPDLQARLIGYSYLGDGIFHTITRMGDGTKQAQMPPAPTYPDIIHSVTLKAETATVNIDQYGDLFLSSEGDGPEYAVEDSKQIYEFIAPRHLNAKP